MLQELTFNAPQRPRFSKQNSMLSCILLSSFFKFRRLWWSSVFLFSVDMHCSYHRGDSNKWNLVEGKQVMTKIYVTTKYLAFQLFKFTTVCCIGARCAIYSGVIIIYSNCRRCHKIIQFFLFSNRINLKD